MVVQMSAFNPCDNVKVTITESLITLLTSGLIRQEAGNDAARHGAPVKAV